MLTLQSERLILRAPEPSDLDVLYRWENDQSLWQVSNSITPVSKFILKEYIKKSHLDIYQVKQLRLMIDLTDNDKAIPVGCIDIFDFDPYHQRAGMGIVIDADYRNQGIASEAIEATVDYGFHTLGLHQLYCNILENNPASLKLFQQQGFEIVGTKKDWVRTQNGWLDELILQRLHL